jgi:hypothetical protein
VECAKSAAFPGYERSHDSLRCPSDCRFFEDRSAFERRAMAAARSAHVRAILAWPFTTAFAVLRWYGKAPWQTQLFLAFALLVILASVYAKALAELVKAVLHGD